MPNRRKPNNVHKLEGTFRKDRHTPKETGPIDVKAPNPPSFLHPEGKREWRRVVKLLEPLNILHETDRGTLTQYCLLWVRLSESSTNTEVEFNAADHTQMRMLASELGLTPTSRDKLARVRKEEKADPWADL